MSIYDIQELITLTSKTLAACELGFQTELATKWHASMYGMFGITVKRLSSFGICRYRSRIVMQIRELGVAAVVIQTVWGELLEELWELIFARLLLTN